MIAPEDYTRPLKQGEILTVKMTATPGGQAYFNIGRRGEMTIRGQVMNVLEYIQELDGRIADIEAMRYEDDYMHFAGAKFQVDGALEASYTNEPHNGLAWNVTIWKPEDLNEAVRAFHDAGYQVALHTAGDAALDMALEDKEVKAIIITGAGQMAFAAGADIGEINQIPDRVPRTSTEG